MNFDFSDEQKQFQEQVNRALVSCCPIMEVRRCLEDGADYARETWKILADLGVLGAAIPEVYGGGGFSHLELCVAAEEIGRALAPVPVASSIYGAAELLLLAGTEEQKVQWLPRMASGEVIATIATCERTGTEARVESGKIYASKGPVGDGFYADLVIVEVQSSLFIVDLKKRAVQRRSVKTIDPSKAQAQLQFNGVAVEPLGLPGMASELLDRARQRAAVLLSFEQLGGADRALEIAKDYVLERWAFGRQIGSYQAIKHKLADIYVGNQLARGHAYYGAWALTNNSPELARAAASARVAATQAFLFAAQESLQSHGGIGFTWEADCHLFYKRARHTALVLGSMPQWKERIIFELERQNVD